MKGLSLQWRITIMTALLTCATCVLTNCLVGYKGMRYMDAIGSDISHIDTDGKHIDDIDSVLPKDPGGAQPVTAGAPAGVSAEPGAVSTDEDVDDIMDETED